MCSCFDLIECLWNGDSVSVDKSNADELVIVSRELENDELSKLLIDFHLYTEEISNENCVSRLRVKQSLGLDGGDEIEFIASKFYEFDASFVRSLSVNELVCVTPIYTNTIAVPQTLNQIKARTFSIRKNTQSLNSWIVR